MLELVIAGLSQDAESKLPIVVLCTTDNSYILPVWVGTTEAVDISLALKGARTTRPLIHELVLTTLKTLDASLQEVQFLDVSDKIFYTCLKISNKQGVNFIECRPSDAMVLAIRASIPIFATQEILDKAAYKLDTLLSDETVIPVLAGDGIEEIIIESISSTSEKNNEKKVSQKLEEMTPETNYKM